MCACVPYATCAVLCAPQPCARARALLRNTRYALCAANNAYAHARAPAPRPRVRMSSFFGRCAEWIVVEVGSPALTELPRDQGRAADQTGRNPASAHKTLIQPNLPQRPSGMVNLVQAIRRRPLAIRGQPLGGPSVDDR